MADFGATRRVRAGLRWPAAVAGAMLAGALAAGPAAASEPLSGLDGVTVTVVNGYAGLCLDAVNGGPDNPGQNGDRVQVWSCNGASQQQWTFHDAGRGWYTITNGYAGLCLDAVTSNQVNPSYEGDVVQVWACNGADQQLWRPGPRGSLENGYAGLVLDAPDNRFVNPSVNGDLVEVWRANGRDQQYWH